MVIGFYSYNNKLKKTTIIELKRLLFKSSSSRPLQNYLIHP